MLTYSQGTGQLRRDGVLLALCYAGNGLGLNNPAMQHVKSVGPVVRGLYTLRRRENTKLGPVVFDLVPDKRNQMLGRGSFLIHWDSRKSDFAASHGCIVPVMPGVFKVLKDGEILEVTA